MRRIHLDQRWIDYLTTQPEQGMSYQRVNVTFANGAVVKDALVTNCEWLFVTGGGDSPVAQLTISDTK